MKAETVYQKLIEKANKNFTNGTIALDRARAVYLFNEEQNKFVEWSLQKRATFDVDDIQALLVSKSLDIKESGNTFSTFKLPDNFFSFSNVDISASKGTCTSERLLPTQVKSENLHELIFDEDNKPSFKYRDTLYTIENNTIKVYKDDFSIDSVYLKYYRYPKQFNLEGYITEEGQNSFNSDPEFDDKIVDRIISMCATSFDINNENMGKLQADVNRVASKF